MGNSIKPQIQNAEKTGVCQLCNCDLSEFPRDLFSLKTLRTLDISGNKISNIPSNVGLFVHLKHLTANNNKISQLPKEIGNLTKLESLSLNGNRLTALPSTLSQLKNLRTVSISNNHLTKFPVVFCDLPHLDMLDLSHNKITEVPDDLQNLFVAELNMNQNQLSELPEAIALCPRLKVLRVEENCLQLSAISLKILTDSLISLLAVDGNLFELKDLHNMEGYEKYMERYTATKKKMF
ncbi:leucine-rich repeat-containing protein 57-like [Centruroides vittatus]|uniref:leucine-rich repeat-containing protein 57-like n=1 Tax=Centruroides vittatus TaxID=120091 RepID=UPI0035108E70